MKLLVENELNNPASIPEVDENNSTVFPLYLDPAV